MTDVRGFTLVEMVVAMALTVIAAAVASALAIEAQAMWRADTARVDLSQRGRVAADTLAKSLVNAGAGPDSGPARGPLVRVLAPILPRRIGVRRPDAIDVFRSDTVSVLYALADAEHATLLSSALPGTAMLDLAAGCALPSCGFTPGASAMVLDSSGHYDVFTVTAAQAATLSVRHHGAGSAVTYPPGTPVLHMESRSFAHDASARTLRVYDGDGSDLPLLDDVVGMEVDYYGDVLPPATPRPAPGEANCLYSADGTLRPHATLDASFSLAPQVLNDGPWCGAGGNQFDVDLLRVRRVRVRLRLQAGDPAVRGRNPGLFREPGSARRPGDTVPDATIVVDVNPRNMRQGW